MAGHFSLKQAVRKIRLYSFFTGLAATAPCGVNEINILSKQHHVIAIDIVGEAGNSDENRLDLNSGEYADWIGEIMNKLGIQKAVAYGEFLWRMVILEICNTLPGARVEAGFIGHIRDYADEALVLY